MGLCENVLRKTLIIKACLALLLLGCWADIAGDNVHAARRKVIVKEVPFFHQKWHFD